MTRGLKGVAIWVGVMGFLSLLLFIALVNQISPLAIISIVLLVPAGWALQYHWRLFQARLEGRGFAQGFRDEEEDR